MTATVSVVVDDNEEFPYSFTFKFLWILVWFQVIRAPLLLQYVPTGTT